MAEEVGRRAWGTQRCSTHVLSGRRIERNYRPRSRVVASDAVHAVERSLFHGADGAHDRRLVAGATTNEVRIAEPVPVSYSSGSHLLLAAKRSRG